jgi:hypothetical protein
MAPSAPEAAVPPTAMQSAKLDSDAGAFEIALEPAAAYQLGFQLIDRALRACRGSWGGGR